MSLPDWSFYHATLDGIPTQAVAVTQGAATGGPGGTALKSRSPLSRPAGHLGHGRSGLQGQVGVPTYITSLSLVGTCTRRVQAVLGAGHLKAFCPMP